MGNMWIYLTLKWSLLKPLMILIEFLFIFYIGMLPSIKAQLMEYESQLLLEEFFTENISHWSVYFGLRTRVSGA